MFILAQFNWIANQAQHVYLWIEGQDIDALEVHSEGAPIYLNLDLEKDLAGYEGL